MSLLKKSLSFFGVEFDAGENPEKYKDPDQSDKLIDSGKFTKEEIESIINS